MELIQNAYRGLSMKNFMMIDNLRLGYQGNATEMARLINDSKVMGDTFVATAENVKDISFDKYIEAIHEIQRQMGITGTSAKEAATTLQGSFAMTKSAWDNLLTGMADPNADFGKLMDNLINSSTALLGNVTPIVERAFKSLGNFVSKAAPIISKELPKLVKLLLPDLINTAYDLLVGLAEALPGMFPVLVDTAWQLFNEIADKMSEKFPVLEPVFDVIKSAFTLIASIGESVGAALKSIWDNFLVHIVDFYGGVFSEFLSGLAKTLDDIGKNKTAVATLTSIITLIASLTAGIKAYHTVMTIVNAVQQAVATSGGILNAIWAANPVGVIVVALGALIAVIVEVITYWDYLVLIWEESGKQWKKWLGDIAKWFSDTWNGIVNGYWWFIDRIVEGAEKIWNDVTGAFSKVGEFFGGLWNDIVSTFSDIGIKVGEAIGGAFKETINGILWTVEGALNMIPNAVNGMLDTINKLPGVNISAIPTVTLPRLAQGGVLRKGQIGFLEGDGDEAVVPLSQNTEWIDRVADKISEKSGNSATYIFNFNIDNVSGNREDMEDNADLLMQIFTEKMSRRGVVFA